MSDRRGKKTNYTKNYRAREEWMVGKKIGRPKQQWEGGRVGKPDGWVKVSSAATAA